MASWWAREIVEAETCSLSASGSALLLLLAAHVNAAYYWEVSVRTLGRGLKRTDRTVQRAIGELVAAGLVRVFPGTGRGHANGYWLPVTGQAPATRKGDTRDTLQVRKGDIRDTLSLSTRVTSVSPFTPVDNAEVIQKGDIDDTERVTPVSPLVDREVSRKRARVFSPAQNNASAPKLTPAKRKRAEFLEHSRERAEALYREFGWGS